MRILLFVLVAVLFFSALYLLLANRDQSSKIRYIPIGDSYTIGLGVSEPERWPNVMVNNLRKRGVDIEITTNPAVSGYTTQDLINYALPDFEKARPDFATLLMGANDSFQDTDVREFETNIHIILDRVQAALTDKNKLVLVTIPDYSKSPQGVRFGGSRDIEKDIIKYNNVIKKEAQRRGLPVADIFPISQAIGSDESYFIVDGLHPSAKQHLAWEKIIFDEAVKLLK